MSFFNSNPLWFLMVLVLTELGTCMTTQIGLGSRLVAREPTRAWVSSNGTFAFGFTHSNSNDMFLLAIWFAKLPGDRTIVWSPNRDALVTKDAVLELDTTGNLVLTDNSVIIWTSNTSNSGIEEAIMSESGNLILSTAANQLVWQSFNHPSDTLLPNQPLTVSLELTSTRSSSYGGYYALKMLQQPTSVTLALTYNLAEETRSMSNFDMPGKTYNGSYANYSYWSAPDISNITGEVIAVLDDSGSFGILYGESSSGAVYVFKSDEDDKGLSSSMNKSNTPLTLYRLILEDNGNLRLYHWDNNLNGSAQWVPDWAAISNPCDIAGTCGSGICKLGRTKTNATCTKIQTLDRPPDCPSVDKNRHSPYRVSAIQQTSYYFSDVSVKSNYSDVSATQCGEVCLSDCECMASVYGLDDEKPYCWVLKSFDFGGFEDPGSTLFLKTNGSDVNTWQSRSGSGRGTKTETKILVIPIVLSMVVLVGLLCLLLYYTLRKRRALRRQSVRSLTVLGSPANFRYQDLQIGTNNFSELLGIGGFGSVYKGSLADGTLIAVKKLDRVLPHGEKEFITEVNTIGSMHHMNLVRLCGFCSQGSQRLLVYEFMKNGSLDQWIFPSSTNQNKFLDWPTRFHIAICTARGIAYFHEQCRNRVIHCDIKPENILLDEDFCPKVSDFGLAKLMGREHSHVVTMVRGTRGYLAPEWVSNRPITVKADVYSYGMLILEIVGGRRNLDLSFNQDEFYFPGLAFKEMTSGMPIKVVDKRLQGVLNEEEIIRALKVGFWCIQDEVSMRPSMGEVVKMLDGSVDINTPPMPQTVLELIEEGLEHVYHAMKRDYKYLSPSTINTATATARTTSGLGSSQTQATCSYSTMSPR